MKKYNYIPLPKNVVLLLTIVFVVGGLGTFAHDLTHPAKANPGKERTFEVYFNDGGVPHETSFEKNSTDNEFRQDTQNSLDLVNLDFVESIQRNSSPEVNSGHTLNKIELLASPLFLVHRVFQV